MIYPSASEILRCIDRTLLTVSDEATPQMAVKSALATSRHLIRHVDLRMQLERSILLDDIEKAVTLLKKIAEYFEAGGSDKRGRAIRSALNDASPPLSAAADEAETVRLRAKALRELIYSSLAQLQSAPAKEKSTDSYREMRTLLREYMTYQIQQEARMVTPAFLGHGPRR